MPKLNPPTALQRRRFGIVKESVRVETLARDLIEEAAGSLRENGECLRGYCPVCGNGNHSRAFQVSQEKNLWNCFACGEGGDVIELAQLTGDFQYASEAVAWLGYRYGIELPDRPDSWFRKQTRQERLREQVENKRREIKRRRLFKYLMLPVLEEVPEQDRDKETEIAWAEFRKLPLG